MASNRQTAEAILNSELLGDLIEEYQQQQFQTFINSEDERVWAKARAAKELHGFIINKCEGIVSE